MKKLFFLSMMALVCFSCYTDETVMNPEIKFNPEEASSPYVIPVEEALQTLTTALERIDGSTRSGRMRSPLSVDRVKLAEAVAITRSAELPDVEDLFYIVSFGEGNGSAVLGADRRLDKIYAILDETILSPEDFYFSSTRSEGLEGNNSEGGADDESDTADEPKMISSDEELEEFVTGMMVDSAVGTLAITLPNPGIPGWPPETPIPGPGVPTQYEYDTVRTTIIQRPLTLTKWNQTAPFNQQFDYKTNGSGERYYVGCGVIAVAQLLTFYQYPNPNVIDGITYNWDAINMCTYEEESNPNNYDALGIYILSCYLRHLAEELGADFTNTGTSTAPANVANYFQSIGYTNAEVALWNLSTARNVIYEDESPLIINGWREGGKGHSWLLDGWEETKISIYRYLKNGFPNYDTPYSVSYEDTLVHCNYGWKGKCDGYYTPGIYDVSQELEDEYIDTSVGDYGGTNGNYIYDRDFNMITK